MMALLNSLTKKSRTTHLLLKALIWPVILIMRFARASREARWPLLIHTLKLMLPYFAAAGHWHCLRYASVYIMKMTKLPKNLFKNFLDGEHAMRHQNGHMVRYDDENHCHAIQALSKWNDGLTFIEKALNRWAKILHISSIIEKNPA